MTQSRIDFFTVPAVSVAAARERRLALLAEKETSRRTIAEALGLEWPRPYTKRSPGKPSRQQKWTDALYEHIQSDRPLPDGTTLGVPQWWRSGSIMPADSGALVDEVMSSPARASSAAAGGSPMPAGSPASTESEGAPKPEGAPKRQKGFIMFFP